MLLALPLVLAACSSGPSAGGSRTSSSDVSAASLQSANAKVLDNMTTYESKAASCKSASNPIVCLETADRALGDQIHSYANLLAVGKGFSVSTSDVIAARNQAQTLANSLEILGDAQPTRSNYDQVLNTFNVNGAIGQLRAAVNTLNGVLGG